MSTYLNIQYKVDKNIQALAFPYFTTGIPAMIIIYRHEIGKLIFSSRDRHDIFS
jgi:hypothetical protein